MSDKIIGIDIGATKTHIGVVQDSSVVDELIFPTSSNAPKDQIISEIIEGIEKFSDSDFIGIGIGVPGLVDEQKGIVYDLWNIPSWKVVHLKEHLENHFKKPVRITNDANTFAMGEKKYGKGSAYRNFVGITLGSGFGTGIIIHDELYSGTLSSAGELGDIPYLDKTIENYCSGKFFREQYGLEGSKVYELAAKGDAKALKIFDEYGYHLGNTLKMVINILSPEAILLGGSVSKSFNFFEKSLQERMDSFSFKKVIEKITIIPSEIPNISILGCAALIDTDDKKLIAELDEIR